MAVDTTWRSPDGRWLVDLVVDEPGVAARVWDEGAFAAEATSLSELDRWLRQHGGTTMTYLRRVPSDDPWCE
jgi:hypothetical protein